ncbi:MAG: hypothetical protein AUI14_16365 [Actinobacteria bacterium 13_2_20CM_2_71_6]|nr:MAG: hypothetical protein AUI14_16365 [Actinobacteria bacterium 13_2_20CM_2_71_6]
MPVPHSRRDVLRAGGLVAGGALLTGGLTQGVARAATAPVFTTMTPATKVAARTDRRPVAGGVYDPAANQTFICWAGKNEDTYVQAYDHATGRWTAPVRILGGRGDSHNYPTMVQADDGRLLILVGMHNSQLVLARAPQPHSIAGTWTVRNVPEGPAASYPMPFKTADGTLFVLYRETTPGAPTDTRRMLYVRSTDHGATWRSSKQLTGQPFALGSTNRPDHLNEVYMGQLRVQPAGAGRPERVHLVWTIAGGGPGKHVHDSFHKDIYYATFDPAALTFGTVAGANLGPQVNDAELDPCRVLLTPLARPGGLKSPDYIQLVGWLDDGRPFLLWITSDSKALLHNSAAVWTGTGWSIREVATGLRTRDMEPVGPDTWRVYANREGQPNIATFLLSAGRDWTAETVITTRKEIQRLEVLSGAKDPARVLATGNSSARSVSVADGDIYVAGLAG